MNKVGILTYHNGFNYGACLQAYALQQVVRRYYPDTEIINFESIDFLASREMFSRKPQHFKEIVKIVSRLPFYSVLKAREYSGTFVKTKIDKFLNVSGNSPCGIE